MKKTTKRVLSIVLCLLLIAPFATMNATAKSVVTKHVGPSGARSIMQFPKDKLSIQKNASAVTPNHQRSYFGDDAWIFRNQLSDFQKVIYDEMLASRAGLDAADYPYEDFVYDEDYNIVLDDSGEPLTKTYTYKALPIDLTGFTIGADTSIELIDDILTTDVIAAFSAFGEDYPEYFWLWSLDFDLDYTGEPVYDSKGNIATDEYGREIYSDVTLTDFTFLVYYYEDGFDSWDEVQTAYDTLMAGVNSVTVPDGTRYEKIKWIHDWICTQADYDFTYVLPHAYDPLGIFVDPYDFVCEGYSEIFKILCDRENIPCITIVGFGGGDGDWEGHKWNYVQMDNGEWYAMDVTWDDQDYRDDDTDQIFYEYFLSGSETYDISFGHMRFDDSHYATGAVFNYPFYLDYPELSAEMYYNDDNYETSTDGLWHYQINEDGTTIRITTGYSEFPAYLGTDTEVVIPSTIDGYTVTEVGTCAFCGLDEITSITLPETVTSIYRFAFEGCTALEDIELNEGLVSISYGAFTDCASLAEISFPSTLDWIGWYVFYGCDALETVVIPANITEIGDYTFAPTLAAIYGYTDTYAEDYAQYANIRFIPLDANGNPTEPLYKGFPDVNSGDWFFDAVKYNASRGFITGFGNGNFGPANPLQRQDFVVILARIAGVDLSGYTSCTLKDVDMNAYYGPAVAWAVDCGIITGYNSGFFGVGDKITREQVCTILYRYMGSPDVGNMATVINTLKPFNDRNSISAYAKDAMVWAIQNGIITGKNATTLAPGGNAARAEIATIIMRMDLAYMFE